MMLKHSVIGEKIVAFVFILLLLAACNNGERFTISGNLPDNTYDGEWLYLVPLVNAPIERVDSVIIKDGKFVFSGRVQEPEVFILRAKPFLRLSLQELLVVKESGDILATIGQRSSVTGTDHNDSLQNWKEQKELFDIKTNLVEQVYYGGFQAQRDSVRPMMEKLLVDKNNFHFNFAKNNSENVVGQLVIRMMKGTFSPEQQNELGIQ